MKHNLIIVLLYPVLAVCALAEQDAGAKVSVCGNPYAGPLIRRLGDDFQKMNPETAVGMTEVGNGGGANALLNRKCDMAVMTRLMNERELKTAKRMTVVPKPHTIAFDAILVVIHPSNQVALLSTTDVHRIFVGSITNWQQVGGTDSTIARVSREPSSGTYEFFESLFLRGSVAAECNVACPVEWCGSDDGVRNQVRQRPNAIGFIRRASLDDTVRALRIGDAQPTPLEIAGGKYPITRTIYLYTDGEPKPGSPLETFLRYVESDSGKSIIDKAGMLPPVPVNAKDKEDSQSAPRELTH